MRVGLLVALCGCNQVFGLQQTQPATPTDAQFFDAPIDGAIACPQPGTTAPRFSPFLRQTIDEPCRTYLPSANGFALGQCDDFTGIGYGPIDQPLKPAPGFPDTIDYRIAEVVLAPSGDVAYLEGAPVMVNGVSYSKYQLSGGTWTPVGGALPFGFAQLSMSSVATGSSGDRILISNGLDEVDEWIEDSSDPSGWSIKTRYGLADLGLSRMPHFIGLTSDGLRIVFQGAISAELQMLYADRASLADVFGHAQGLTGIPLVSSLYMTADCSRIYLTGLGTVFYAPGED